MVRPLFSGSAIRFGGTNMRTLKLRLGILALLVCLSACVCLLLGKGHAQFVQQARCKNGACKDLGAKYPWSGCTAGYCDMSSDSTPCVFCQDWTKTSTCTQIVPVNNQPCNGFCPNQTQGCTIPISKCQTPP